MRDEKRRHMVVTIETSQLSRNNPKSMRPSQKCKGSTAWKICVSLTGQGAPKFPAESQNLK